MQYWFLLVLTLATSIVGLDSKYELEKTDILIQKLSREDRPAERLEIIVVLCGRFYDVDAERRERWCQEGLEIQFKPEQPGYSPHAMLHNALGVIKLQRAQPKAAVPPFPIRHRTGKIQRRQEKRIQCTQQSGRRLDPQQREPTGN